MSEISKMRIEQLSESVTLYCGDCLEIAPTLSKIDAVVSDPPYGMGVCLDSTRFSSPTSGPGRNDWPKIIGDNKTFDPSPWLGYRECILWGYNHFAMRLPVGSVLVWNKRPAENYGKFLSDCELAWFNKGHGVYAMEVLESPQRRANEANGRVVHPTQKPISLMEWCVQKTTGAVLDPYMGSGTTGVACVNLDRPFVGIEIQPTYFETALARIDAKLRQKDLFR